MRTRTALSIAFMAAAAAPVLGAPYHDTTKPSGGDSIPIRSNEWSWLSLFPDGGHGHIIPAKRGDFKTGVTTVINDTVQQGLVTQDEANGLLQLVQLFTAPESAQFLQGLKSDIPMLHGNSTTSQLARRGFRGGNWAGTASGVFDGISTASALANMLLPHARRDWHDDPLTNGIVNLLMENHGVQPEVSDLHARGGFRNAGHVMGGISTAADLANLFSNFLARRDWHDVPLSEEVANLLKQSRDVHPEVADLRARGGFRNAGHVMGGISTAADLANLFSNFLARRDWHEQLHHNEAVAENPSKIAGEPAGLLPGYAVDMPKLARSEVDLD